MGNSQTREARQQGLGPSARHAAQSSPSDASASRNERGSDQLSADRQPLSSYTSSGRRGSRPDLSFLGIGNNNERDVSTLEVRRETKQEREARKLEKERAARLKERERSMREEHVDGGYLVTQGVYVGIEDYNKAVVRQLMIERRLAPFWKGLNDFSESWAEHQIMAAARGMPIPPADEVPPGLEYQGKSASSTDLVGSDKHLKNLTVPIDSRSHSYTSAASSYPASSFPPQISPQGSPPTGGPVFRTRAKTLASLTTSSKNNSQAEMTPRELQLPRDPAVNGQPIEVFLYKDASECPICFLYYPPYLNTTRCCDQAICSECFVQIKRPDPHPPEHEQPDANAPSIPEGDRDAEVEGQLVSEVATCPFCKQPEFGITYTPPPFRRGLTYGSGSQPFGISSAMSSQTSVSSTGMSPSPSRRRGTSLSATAPGVTTTDKIRPDWASKLATARAHAARRSAAATALHTAAYLMGGSGQPDLRTFAPFGRRNVLRRPTLEGANGNHAHLDALAMLAERHNGRQQEQEDSGDGSFNPFLPPPRGSSSRRSRMDELEDMMMMEAIRLSLAAEDDRRRKEEKEAKKEAKKKEKETKKAEKAAKKSGLYLHASNTSHPGTDSGPGSPLARVGSASSSFVDEEAGSSGKGKGVDRAGTPPVGIPQRSHYDSPSVPLFMGQHESLALASEPSRPSHLRQMSNASSSASSIMDPGSSQVMTGSNTPPGGGAGTEPMFNFRSLAAMIGDNEKGEETSQLEDNEPTTRPHADSDQSGSTRASSIPPETRFDPIREGSHETHGIQRS